MSHETKTIKETNEHTDALVMDPKEITAESKVVETGDKEVNESVDNISEKESDTKLEFTREVIESLGNKIRLVDSDEDAGLDLFCYIKCSPDDNSVIRNCRGVVFNNKEIVMKAFPYTLEYNDSDIDLVNKHTQNFNKCSFFDSHEGALIRVFNFNGKWYISTHRKLNAFRSKWASKDSFGTSFKNALVSEATVNKEFSDSLPKGENILERFYTLLDKSKQYMFLVKNTSDNRIVCNPASRPTLFHVGTFVDGKLVLDEDIKIPRPQKHNFLNIDEVFNYVKKCDFMKIQGVICFTPDNVQFKILHNEYQELFKARGNEPSIKFRYLQVRMDKKYTNLLYHLYPESAEIFDDYENTLYDIARGIYRAYVQRFIKKRYVTVPREEFKIIRDCHTWHLAERTENRISIEQVIKVMNKQSPTDLNHMLRRFRAEQLRKKEQDNVRTRSNSTSSIISSPVISSVGNQSPTISPIIIGRSGENKSAVKRRTAHINKKFSKPRLLGKKDPVNVDFPPLKI